ncbi:MAG: hypothetical protein HKN82_00565 [Akkermansiaceae bacterium]|nr:hypothetical protein [Akkermansiaceae bacterium]
MKTTPAILLGLAGIASTALMSCESTGDHALNPDPRFQAASHYTFGDGTLAGGGDHLKLEHPVKKPAQATE